MTAITPINEEEKMSILAGLRSHVPATKLITLKKIADIADMRPESLQYMDMTDKRTIQEIINSIEKIANIDQDEVLKREALISLEKIKNALGTKFTKDLITCKNCGKIIDLGWEFCANCGANINKMEFKGIKRCKNCNKNISEEWIYCAHCGILLREKEKNLTCPNCKRPIDPSWMVCPYCGYRLKRIKN
ncbi:zinc ribbon domain-containing protein [Methanothermococcus sp.]|uniref:zinc ribbon domain-containing protein n=1 Tax=Methanothermococcus sp. TaxID=2614238 RepID=UPI0025ED88A0|nr:zinc ribbon domain-containing protein [Methanothermococcus sp.]